MKRFVILLSVALLVCSYANCAPPGEAQRHYTAGEQAYNANDLLTARVEWEAALQLKPESSYTSKRLEALKAAFTPDEQLAYRHYASAVQFMIVSDLKSAQAELLKAHTLRPAAACVKEKLAECTPVPISRISVVIDGSQSASPATAPHVPINITGRIPAGINIGPFKPPLRVSKLAWVIPEAELKARYDELARLGRAGVMAMTNVRMFAQSSVQGEIQNTSTLRFSCVTAAIGYYRDGKKFDGETVVINGLLPAGTWLFAAATRFPCAQNGIPKSVTFQVESIDAIISSGNPTGTAVTVH